MYIYANGNSSINLHKIYHKKKKQKKNTKAGYFVPARHKGGGGTENWGPRTQRILRNKEPKPTQMPPAISIPQKDEFSILDCARRRYKQAHFLKGHGTTMGAGDILQQAVDETLKQQERSKLAEQLAASPFPMKAPPTSHKDVLLGRYSDLPKMAATLQEIARKSNWVRGMVTNYGLQFIAGGLPSQETKEQLAMTIIDKDWTRLVVCAQFKTTYTNEEHHPNVSDNITRTFGKMKVSKEASERLLPGTRHRSPQIPKYRATTTGDQRHCEVCDKWISTL